MRYVSVFSGVEAATLAWEPLGWEPVCFCEIDEFPSAVLRHRWPMVPNLGDITKVAWKEVERAYGAVDLVVGGSPCQSFSIAGSRTGLDGASGLMWEYVRCVRELMPRWILWENVPGALSSSHGEDFRCLLRELDALGYGLAWRVLDAQFFGVAQRRERLFLVGRLGDPAPPAEVLFESESLRWDTPTSREKRKELAAGAGGGAEAAGFKYHQGSGAGNIGYEPEQSPTLTADYHNPAIIQLKGNSIDRDTSQNGRTWCDPDENGTYTLNATDVDGVICIPENDINRPTGGTNGPMAYGEGEPSPTLRSSNSVPAVYIGGDHKASESVDCAGTLPASSGGFKPGAVMCMTDTQPHSMVDPEVCGALSSTMHKDPPVVGFAANQRGEVRLQGGDGDVFGAIPASQSGKQVQGVVCQYGNVAGALTARGDSSPCADRGPSVVSDGCVVRRLTPRECERLQGFPDDWTKVPYRGKPADECPDTPRYKAIGNSMAVPVMRWIGQRIELAERGQ